MDEGEDAVAREMGWTAIQAYGNLVGVICRMASEAGLPSELVRTFLNSLDDANDATISSESGKRFLSQQLSTLIQAFGANSD
ncbi:hypothetical protein [Sphingobium sp. YR657]|uniref:hypothetical protein n=1 Tax=Sphingobium sp. YR657 TaxID=1884366 RepID=UPI003138016D